MEKALFSVSCTTCRARIAVRKRTPLGKSLECPKCGSMVLIVPPDGWVFDEAPPATPPNPPLAEKSSPPSKNGDSSIRRGTTAAREAASVKPVMEPPPVQLPTAAVAASVEVVPPPAPPGRTASPPVVTRRSRASRLRRKLCRCNRPPRPWCRLALLPSNCRKWLSARRTFRC